MRSNDLESLTQVLIPNIHVFIFKGYFVQEELIDFYFIMDPITTKFDQLMEVAF